MVPEQLGRELRTVQVRALWKLHTPAARFAATDAADAAALPTAATTSHPTTHVQQ